MSGLHAAPPPDHVTGSLSAVPGMRFTPGTVTGHDGPEGRLGPEAAEAILILHATFTTGQSVEPFWEVNLPVLERLAAAPGFIRRISVVDAESAYLIAFWRSIEEAQRFGCGRPLMDPFTAGASGADGPD